MQHYLHHYRVGCEDIAAIPLKSCNQCSHYRGGYCYGFGTAKRVFSTAEAIFCNQYTPLGQVQIGPLGSLAGQLTEYQIPTGIISTIKLADLAVTSAKLADASVTLLKIANDVITDAKIDPSAAIAESKLNLTFGTSALNDAINILDTEYGAHDHSASDPTQVNFNDLLNIDPVTLSNIVNSGVINIKPSGDIDDYLEFSTINNVPIITIKGSHYFQLKSDDTYSVMQRIQENATKYLELKWDKQLVHASIASSHALRLIASGDFTNFIQCSTVANVPKIDAIGGNPMQIDGVDVSAEPARISTEIDDEIDTHAAIAAAHHARYADSEAVAAVEGEAVLNVKAIETDGHIYPKVTNVRQLGTSSLIWQKLFLGDTGIRFGAAQDVNLYRSTAGGIHLTTDDDFNAGGGLRWKGMVIDFNIIFDLLMYGAGNAAWHPLPFELCYPSVNGLHASINNNLFSVYFANAQAIDGYWQFVIPLPTNKGSQSLHIVANGIRFYIHTANPTNKVIDIALLGVKTDGTEVVIRTDSTDHSTTGLKTITGLAETDFTLYAAIYLRIHTTNANTWALRISQVSANLFYS